jgi:hypothetical protein
VATMPVNRVAKSMPVAAKPLASIFKSLNFIAVILRYALNAEGKLVRMAANPEDRQMQDLQTIQPSAVHAHGSPLDKAGIVAGQVGNG